MSHAAPVTCDKDGLRAFSLILPLKAYSEQCFFVGKHFCIRGGAEQRALGPVLRIDQVVWTNYMMMDDDKSVGCVAEKRVV